MLPPKGQGVGVGARWLNTQRQADEADHSGNPPFTVIISSVLLSTAGGARAYQGHCNSRRQHMEEVPDRLHCCTRQGAE